MNTAAPLIISISGVRGIAGQSLTAETAFHFGLAFAHFLENDQQPNLNKTIILGRDSRAWGPELGSAITVALQSRGFTVLNIGLVPTPTVQINTQRYLACGGVIITASHNPPAWNGLKFVSGRGIFLTATEAAKFINYYTENSFNWPALPKVEPTSPQTIPAEPANWDAINYHIDRILDNIDVEMIRARHFKIAWDPVNGAACHAGRLLLERLNCQIVALNDQHSPRFGREPEPLATNLADLQSAVVASGAVAGMAQDPDADRLALVTEQGEAPGEDYTLAIAIDEILSQQVPDSGDIPPVVVNLSTSLLVDAVAKNYNIPIIKTKIGEVNVSERMIQERSLIGGEGNGGVIWPKIGGGRDSLAGMALVLQWLARTGAKLSYITQKWPRYYLVKDKIQVTGEQDITTIISKITDLSWPQKIVSVNRLDGIKVSFASAWVQIRASNTEPIWRIMAEAEDLQQAKHLVAIVKDGLIFEKKQLTDR